MTQEELSNLMILLAKFAHENGRENVAAIKTVHTMVANAYAKSHPSNNAKE